MSGRPSLLILSFSRIEQDARVLKQVRLFADRYDVTTCGHGEAPEGVVHHIRVPDGLRSNDLNGRLITARLYRRAYWSTSAVKWAKQHLERGAYDLVLANEVDAVPLALSLRPRLGVHADLHEYHPRVKEEQPLWDRRIRPYVEWQCRRYVTRAASWSTVSEGIAAEYERRFGFRPTVVANATPYFDAPAPSPANDPIRLVHSGGAMRARHLEITIDGVRAARSGATLDLYLTPNDPAHLAELRDLAETSDGRVTIHDPVAYRDLIPTLNAYDAGIHVLPFVNFNHQWALPNKVFDYVQARLAVIVGPSPEMARLVDEYDLGVVTDDFTADAVAASIDALTPEAVTEMRLAAHEHARELAADAEVAKWKQAIDALADRSAA